MKTATEDLIRQWHKANVNGLDCMYQDYLKQTIKPYNTYRKWLFAEIASGNIHIDGQEYYVRLDTAMSFTKKSTAMTHRKRYLKKDYTPKREELVEQMKEEKVLSPKIELDPREYPEVNLGNKIPDYRGVRGFFRRIFDKFNT
jgi:hypothetical protein